jgi:hypothetical protein
MFHKIGKFKNPPEADQEELKKQLHGGSNGGGFSH